MSELTPEPYGELDDIYYDIVQYLPPVDDFDILDYELSSAQLANDEADRLNGYHKTDVYRAVRVERVIRFKPTGR